MHERMYHHGIIDKIDTLELIVSTAEPVAISEKGSMPKALKIVEKMLMERRPRKKIMPKNVPRTMPNSEELSMLPMTNIPIAMLAGIETVIKIFLFSGFRNSFQSIYLIHFFLFILFPRLGFSPR